MIAAVAPACDLDGQLAPVAELDVIIDGNGITEVTNDAGYAITLSRCRVAIADLEFTTDGQMHARASVPTRVWQTVSDLVIPTAHAHPGHDAGGEIVGELTGRFVFDWRADGEPLGPATLLHADYSGVNFTLTRAGHEDGIRSDDPIFGHTFDIAGVASDGVHEFTFSVQIDQDEGRRVIGLPLELSVDDDSDEAIGLALVLADPGRSQTAFDGIDFAALDDDGDGHVTLTPDSEAYLRLRRNLQVHTRYGTAVR